MPHLHISLVPWEETAHITPDSVQVKSGLEEFTDPVHLGNVSHTAHPGLLLVLYLKRPSSSCPVNYISFLFFKKCVWMKMGQRDAREETRERGPARKGK